MNHDAIVIGAGISGLVAATELQRDGYDVVVLEARDRVGGRTLSKPLGSDVIDLGGQWVGPTQTRALALIAELGLETFPQHHEGEKLLHYKGRKRTYSGTIPSLPIWSLVELELTIRRLDYLADRLDPAAPWAHPKAREYDSYTVATWLDRHVRSAAARFSLEAALRAVFVCEPRDLSFLFCLFYVRAAGGLMDLVSIPGGAQQDRLHGGVQQISRRLAEDLDVRLESPAQRVEWSADSVTVTSDSGELSAKRCIAALSPSLATRIDWASGLPGWRRQLHQRMPMGSVIKCIAAYESPFWRDDGLSGEALCDHGPVRVVFDDSPADAAQGALIGFIAGADAHEWSATGEASRRAAVLSQWAELFGPRAAKPVAYVDQDWTAEAWSGGCYVGLMGPGTMTGLGPRLREPIGPIHWAGTETATRWCGYFEGAIEAGERAASEVAASLR